MFVQVVHRVKVVQISGARISKEQHNEEHTVTLMMEFLSDFEGVLNPRDRFFDLGVRPAHHTLAWVGLRA